MSRSSGAVRSEVTSQIIGRLAALGLELPTPPLPAGAYKPVVIRGGIGAVSGQFPSVDGKLVFPGRVGAELTEEQGFKAAQLAALNILGQIAVALDGFDRLGGLIRLDGHVASAPGYLMQPRVLDGASQLLTAALGSELGAHTRTAYSAEQLPLGSCMELSVLFAVHEDDRRVDTRALRNTVSDW